MSDAPHPTNEAHEHDEAHHGPWFLGHHWETPSQQFEAGKLGMWLFLATEVLLFGGLFCAYAIWRGNNPGLFKYGSEFLETKWGAINTAVLITSSLTMAWAVTAAQRNQQTLLKALLALTLCGAVGFLGIKYVEYMHKFHEGWFPGQALYENSVVQSQAAKLAEERAALETPPAPAPYAPPPPVVEGAEPSTIPPPATPPRGVNVAAIDKDHSQGEASSGEGDHEGEPGHDEAAHESHVHPVFDPDRPPNVHMFFNIYFMMTGLHGLHVIFGGAVILWILVKAMKGRYNDEYFTQVDLGALYWHVVDLIWIFLFPLFYLI